MPAGAGAEQGDLLHRIGIDGDGVGDAHHLRDGGALRHHGRVHPLLDAVLGLYRHAQQLHPVA